MRTIGFCVVAVALTLAAAIESSYAVLVDLGPGLFLPEATVIEFDEVPVGTENPVYTLVTASLGTVTVTFGGHFVGQTVCSPCFPVTLVDTTPTGPLALDPAAPVTFTTTDDAPGATSPTLSGTPTFNGPIAVLFDVPVAAVGLKGGFFDAVGSTMIEAFAADGSSLGSITNSLTGFEFYGLLESSGANVISGISFYITGLEAAGFEIDNLTFGSAAEVVPEPGTLLLLGSGAAALAAGRLRRRIRR